MGDSEQKRRIRIAGRIDGSMKIQIAAGLKEFQEKFGLHQRLSARKGDTPVGLIVKSDIFLDLPDHLCHRYSLANKFHSRRRAMIRTGSTQLTFGGIRNHAFSRPVNRFLGACL